VEGCGDEDDAAAGTGGGGCKLVKKY